MEFQLGKLDWNPLSFPVTGFRKWDWVIWKWTEKRFSLNDLFEVFTELLHNRSVSRKHINQTGQMGVLKSCLSGSARWRLGLCLWYENEVESLAPQPPKYAPYSTKKVHQKTIARHFSPKLLHNHLILRLNPHLKTYLMGSYRHDAQKVFVVWESLRGQFGVWGSLVLQLLALL